MLEPLEGSQAIAHAVALARPGVVAAYPITPQTHIVEHIAKLVADAKLRCEYVSVESEFSAATVALGAAAAGCRAYTATASQGLLLMAEVLFNIAGMRIPMVLTCANRAVSAPINIWNDHQDAMAVRDAGWVQLYCASNQEAIDTTIQAFLLAERLELPVMVCVDGYILTHTLEGVMLPSQEEVDRFLPPYAFARTLDSQRPLTMGTMVAPDHFTEIRHAHDQAMHQALEAIEAVDAAYAAITGRASGGLLEVDGPDDASIGVLCLGAAHGTLWEAREQTRNLPPAKLIKLRAFRPFPAAALRQALTGLTDVVVLERAFSPGAGGIVAAELCRAFHGMAQAPRIHSAVMGLGGRDIPLEAWQQLLDLAQAPQREGTVILDLIPEHLEEGVA